MTAAFYIPIWFNLALFMSGITLIFLPFFALLAKIYPWFICLPILVYGIHFSIFYGFISFSQITGNVLNNETMTFWSAILRSHGLITAFAMIYIVRITLGKKCHE